MINFKGFIFVFSILFFCILLVSALDSTAQEKLNSADNFLLQGVIFGVGLIVFILLALIVKAFYQRYFI